MRAPERPAATAERAGRWFLDRGVGAAVITLAGQGSCVVTADGASVVPPFPVDAVDTTAAGDAFTAALAVAHAEGRSLPDAARFANAAGAVTCTTFGAQPALPTRDQVETLMA